MFRQYLPGLSPQENVGEVVESGLVAVDYHEEGAVPFRQQGEACRGLDGKRRPGDDAYLGPGADIGGFFHFLLRHGLAEGYRLRRRIPFS